MLWIRHAFNRYTQMLHPSEACQLYLPLIVCQAQVEGRWALRHLLSQRAQNRGPTDVERYGNR